MKRTLREENEFTRLIELFETDQLNFEESLAKTILVFDIIKAELLFLSVATNQDQLPLGDTPGF